MCGETEFGEEVTHLLKAVDFVQTHPLYLGCVLMMFGAPLLLGSVFGMIISVIAAVVLVGRIIGEENMLVNELEGYADYKKKVSYRLIPYIW